MKQISEQERLNLEYVYWDSLFEGEENPLIRLYYWIRMKGVEIWKNLKGK
jgi:hypothetical protein